MAAAVVPQAYNNPLRHIGSTRPTRVRSPEEAIGSVRAVRAASSVQSQGGACLQFDPGRGTSAVVRITISVLSPRGRQGRRDRAQYPGRAFQHGVPRALVSVTSNSLSLALSVSLSTFSVPWSALLSPCSVPEAARAAAIVPSTQGAPFSTVFHARSSLSLHSLSPRSHSLPRSPHVQPSTWARS